MSRAITLLFLVLGLSALIACKSETPAAANTKPESAESTNSTASETAQNPSPAAPAKMSSAKRINPERAMKYVRDIVGIGARSLGSPGHRKVQTYIKAKLAGDHVEDDPFPVDSPSGKFDGNNIIAKYPGNKDGIIVLASHYDTNYGLKDYVGANDGGSTTGLLLELANQLRGARRDGYSVWLVWFDAEEAVKQWSDTDKLYGSRHLANKWQQDGTLPKIKALILLDMIGDADLSVDDDANSTPWLKQLIHHAASQYGYQSYFFNRQIGGVDDDHVPFVQKGVPAIDLIDFDYGYNDVYHHTPQDTLDKLSPKSLQVIGDTVLQALPLIDTR